MPLTLKAFDTLFVLVANSGRLLEKDELLKQVWPDTFVEENTLTTNISTLRKVLGDGAGGQKFIETVPKRGYRFVGEVREISDEAPSLIVEEHLRSRVVIEEAVETESPNRPFGPNVASRVTDLAMSFSPSRAGRLTLAAAVVIIGLVIAFSLLKRQRDEDVSRSGARITSVAVLPFRSLAQPETDAKSGDPKDAYLELGLADAVITRLSRLKQIIVRPTGAVRKYSEPAQDPIAAGRELNVDAVLDGSLQELSDRIRVTVRLVRVSDASSIWSQKFDEKPAGIFDLEDSISERVADALAVAMTPREKEELKKNTTKSAEAYELYLKGRYLWSKRSEDGLRKGIASFRLAIDSDPTYAQAYAGMADCYIILYDHLFDVADEAIPQARAAAARALDLDDSLAEAHTSMAYIHFLYDHDMAAAEREFLRAIDLNPGYATARQWYSRLLASLGRFEEANVEIQKAAEIDPLSAIINSNLAVLFYLSREYEQAGAQCRKTISIDPSLSQPYWVLANSYDRMGNYQQAVEYYDQSLRSLGQADLAQQVEQSYQAGGYHSAVQKLADGLKSAALRYPTFYHSLARYSAVAGDKDQAIESLQKAFEQHNPWLIDAKVEPQFDGLRSDPRFTHLLGDLGLQ
ncbi:MAG: winged helix-turn-helix domain-containing tetratricopeptide repeat protein [Blastocatellia bacterium]